MPSYLVLLEPLVEKLIDRIIKSTNSDEHALEDLMKLFDATEESRTTIELAIQTRKRDLLVLQQDNEAIANALSEIFGH
jgi:hypothetical protein